MRYFCCAPRRLQAVKNAGMQNGIEYAEVRDSEEPVQALRQRTLYVRLLQPVPPGFGPGNVVISGGERIPSVAVEWAVRGDAAPPDLVTGLDELDHLLVVRTSDRGDFSLNTLRLVAAAGSDTPPAGFDPLLLEVEFSFKVECPSDFDCSDRDPPPPQPRPSPPIDYLAKDFQGFRRIMLERMALLASGWTERNPADLGIAMVEALAYHADALSYWQDASATDAYLGTARSRISLRRLARLVDYRVHDGCNARVWVRVLVGSPRTMPAKTQLLTRVPGLPDRIVPGSRDYTAALAAHAVIFETVSDAPLHPDLEQLHFYTWGEQGCFLPRGATEATLRGAHPALRPGDVLVLAQSRSPATGMAEDADPTVRWAVRLVDVRPGTDPSGGLFDTPPSAPPVDVTEITWHAKDALPFPLQVNSEHGDVETAVAWGNVVLADHGATHSGEPLGTVPPPRPRRLPTVPVGPCEASQPATVPARFRPTLVHRPITRAMPLAGPNPSATATTAGDPRMAEPAIVLHGTLGPFTTQWDPQPDLLASGKDKPHFTVETEHDGTVLLRFGDDEHGRRPQRDTVFTADLRVGNGVAGNVGAETIAHVVSADPTFSGVRNPLPAAGGTDPETAQEIRRDAPYAFAMQERAVTEADWVEVTQRDPEVERAAATFRWTGSWHTVFVTADRSGGAPVDRASEDDLRRRLETYRLAGYDLEVDGPRFVALELGLHVCVAAGHFRSDVTGEVLAVLGTGVLANRRRGLFHPDNLTFGQPIFLSTILAAVHAVAGVESVTVLTFQRQRQPESSGLDAGVLTMGRLEIPRLDNNPDFPERGALALTLGGGA